MIKKDYPFPIRTKTSCLLKWNWSTIWITSGTTNSCHRNWRVPLPLDDFDNFHNLPYKIDHRESMLKGEWPHSPNHLGCGYCRKIEEAGGRSDRQFMTETQTDQTPPELINDPTATHVSPTILEVFLNRTCNMACTYCSVFYSSRLAADAKKFNNPEFDDKYFKVVSDLDVLPVAEMEKYNAKLLDWISRKGTTLRRFHVLGGEPFFQPEFDDYVKIWNDYPNPNLVFNVVSNFNVHENRFKEKIDSIMNLVYNGKIERFDLTASVDCWGPEQEYVRRGFKCDRFDKNMRYVLQFPEIRVNMNATHTLMSLGAYTKLLDKKAEWEAESGRHIALYGMAVSGNHVDPHMLGGDFFKDVANDIRKSHPLTTWDDQQALKNIDGILQKVEQSKPDLSMMKDFLTVYNELDRRHGTDWRATFPDIASEIDKHIIV